MLSEDEALAAALQWVAPPGTSEHELGLAVGINDEEDDEGMYAWLASNAHQYGFILRYPLEGRCDGHLERAMALPLCGKTNCWRNLSNWRDAGGVSCKNTHEIKKPDSEEPGLKLLVGTTGFEPATP